MKSGSKTGSRSEAIKNNNSHKFRCAAASTTAPTVIRDFRCRELSRGCSWFIFPLYFMWRTNVGLDQIKRSKVDTMAQD